VLYCPCHFKVRYFSIQPKFHFELELKVIVDVECVVSASLLDFSLRFPLTNLERDPNLGRTFHFGVLS
jgi:hypothetical protein